MSKVIITGRLTRDPEVRYSQGQNTMAIAQNKSIWNNLFELKTYKRKFTKILV